MQKFQIENFTKGWFIGDFTPSLHPTAEFEVGLKQYKKGDIENPHYHKIATEFTIVVEGKVKMNDTVITKFEGLKVLPGTTVKFEAIEDSTTLVIKTPSITNDKYTEF